jgi:hypothetical protein
MIVPGLFSAEPLSGDACGAVMFNVCPCCNSTRVLTLNPKPLLAGNLCCQILWHPMPQYVVLHHLEGCVNTRGYACMVSCCLLCGVHHPSIHQPSQAYYG